MREVNLWADAFSKVTVLSPSFNETGNSRVFENKKKILAAYNHKNLNHKVASTLHFKSVRLGLKSISNTPKTLVKIYRGCSTADHIHLRCPGNIGLLGLFGSNIFSKDLKNGKICRKLGPKGKATPELSTAKMDFIQHIFNPKYQSIGLRRLAESD